MRLSVLFLALGSAFSLTSAQWVETTLTVPDTLGRMLKPVCFSYDSADNTVYVGGNACVIAVDGATNEKIARIPTGPHVVSLCYNPQNNRVYSASDSTNDVTVIDCAAHSASATISVGESPVALCYNPQNNRVYCANARSDDVTVIDGASSAVIATVSVGHRPWALCYKPQNNKIYCANDSSGNVTVIDGAGDSVITTVTVDTSEHATLCYNPQDNKIYCASDCSGNVAVIDGTTDSVIRTVAVGGQPRALCYNPGRNKVYCAGAPSAGVTVMDGASDSIVAVVATDIGAIALCYNRQYDRVYCASTSMGRMKVIDGATNSVVDTVTVGDGPVALCYNPQNNKVYCADQTHFFAHPGAVMDPGGTVTVVDGATDTVITTVVTGDRPRALCYNSQNNRVYCADYASGSVTIIDGATNSIISTVRVGALTTALCYNSRNNEVYCANGGYNYVTVIDGATNLVTDSVQVGRGTNLLCYNPQNDKVYALAFGWTGSLVHVIDCATKQVVALVSVGLNNALMYCPRSNAVYCSFYEMSVPEGRVTVISGATDSVIAVIDSTGSIASLCSAPIENKIFCSDGVVIDAAANRVIDTVPTDGGDAVCYNIQNNRVYYSLGTAVAVVDCATDSVLATVSVGTRPVALLYNALNNKIYCVNRMSNDVTVIAGANNKVRKTLAVGLDPRLLEWNWVQNRIYVANDGSSSITVLRDSVGQLGDLDVDPDSLDVGADTIRLRGRGSYAVGGFVLVNTSAAYNPDPSDGPSQSPVDSLNYLGSLTGPGGTLDSILIPYLPDSLAQGQAVTCTLAVYLPPGLPNGTYSGSIQLTGRDASGSVVVARSHALIKKLGDLDVDPDSMDVVTDTIRVQSQVVSSAPADAGIAGVPRVSAPSHVGLSPAGGGAEQALQPDLGRMARRALTGYELGRFILANTSTFYNPDTSDGPSQSRVDSLSFTGSLTGPGGTIDSIRILSFPGSLAQGQAVVCTLAVSVPDSLSNGDYAGPIVITGFDSLHYETAETVYALVQKHGGGVALGDLDVDNDSLDVVHDTVNLQTQPAGPVYSPYAKARFMLVNAGSSYNPDAEDGPSQSLLREVKVEAEVEGLNGTPRMVNGECRIVKSGSTFHSSQFTTHSSSSRDSVYVLNLPESLAVGQAVECTLALVIPVGESAGGHSGWVSISAYDTLGYRVQDSFFVVVHGPEPRQSLDSLVVAPIPFKPHQNPEHDAIHFQGLSAGARVIVYDASGQAVWTATEQGDGHLKWDAKVASGVYVYLVVTADGKSSKTGKLSVIR